MTCTVRGRRIELERFLVNNIGEVQYGKPAGEREYASLGNVTSGHDTQTGRRGRNRHREPLSTFLCESDRPKRRDRKRHSRLFHRERLRLHVFGIQYPPSDTRPGDFGGNFGPTSC